MVNFRVASQEFCMVRSYTEDLENHRTVKIKGCMGTSTRIYHNLPKVGPPVAKGAFLLKVCLAVVRAVMLGKRSPEEAALCKTNKLRQTLAICCY